VVPLLLGEKGTEEKMGGRGVVEREEEEKGRGEPRICLNCPRRRACSY